MDVTASWGEHANSRLLDDLIDGPTALAGYAREIGQVWMPTVADILGLLDEVEMELVYVPSEDARLAVMDAADRIRGQLTTPAPAVPAAAA